MGYLTVKWQAQLVDYRNNLSLRSTWVHPQYLVGLMLLHLQFSVYGFVDQFVNFFWHCLFMIYRFSSEKSKDSKSHKSKRIDNAKRNWQTGRQNHTQKTEDGATLTPPNTGDELRCSARISCSSNTFDLSIKYYHLNTSSNMFDLSIKYSKEVR
jgi:hypothetical protein